MSAIGVVTGKELLDGIRDKRAVLSAMLFPIMAPVLVFMMLTFLIDMRTESIEKPIPIMGGENAPAFMQWLDEHGVTVEAFEGDARAAVTDKSQEVVLIIPEGYGQKFSESRTAIVELVNDGSRTDAQPTAGRVRGLIRRYNNEVAALRLIVRGVSPEVMRVVEYRDVELASRQELTAAALSFIPLYIILAGFISGMGIAVDGTAGERERQTLEPLLINPVERHDIVLGKWIAASMFASFGMLTTLVLCVIAMGYVPLEELGFSFSVTPSQVFGMAAATLPLAFLATSMQLLLGIFAKSFKDAQSYIGLLTLFPMVPFMITLLNPVATQAWMFAIPMFNQHLLLTEVMGGQEVAVYAYVLSAISTLLMSLTLVMVTGRLFKRENIISN